jgi:hypothetical protein
MADFDTLWIFINVVPLCCIVHILTTFPSFHSSFLQYLWMAKAEPQIIVALSASGEAQNARESI